MEKRECLGIGGNINFCSHCENQYEGSSKKKKSIIELPYDPATPLLIYKGNKTYLKYMLALKERNPVIFDNMDETLCFSEIEENIVFSEISQTEEWYHLYVELFRKSNL